MLYPIGYILNQNPQSVKNGGRAEFDKMKQVLKDPKTLTFRAAAMYAPLSDVRDGPSDEMAAEARCAQPVTRYYWRRRSTTF